MPIASGHPSRRRFAAPQDEAGEMEVLMVRSGAKASRLEPWHTDEENQLAFLSFADLVVVARSLNPFPYRTRPLNSSAPMVLSLKAWKSRSLPGLPRTENSLTMID